MDEHDAFLKQVALAVSKQISAADQSCFEANARRIKSQQSRIDQLCILCGSKDNKIRELQTERYASEWWAEANNLELNGEIRKLNETIMHKRHEIMRLARAVDIKNATIDKQAGDIEGLEAELSVRKGDSKVLWEVVKIVEEWGSNGLPIQDILSDYLDIPDVEDVYVDEYTITLTLDDSSEVD